MNSAQAIHPREVDQTRAGISDCASSLSIHTHPNPQGSWNISEGEGGWTQELCWRDVTKSLHSRNHSSFSRGCWNLDWLNRTLRPSPPQAHHWDPPQPQVQARTGFANTFPRLAIGLCIILQIFSANTEIKGFTSFYLSFTGFKIFLLGSALF